MICLLQPGGFTIEVTNNNSTMVMTGMRIQIGTQAIERAPSYLEIFGRTMQLNMTRARWFDFPFTREEALQADKKLTIFSKSSLIVCFDYLLVLLGCVEATVLCLVVGRVSTSCLFDLTTETVQGVDPEQLTTLFMAQFLAAVDECATVPLNSIILC